MSTIRHRSASATGSEIVDTEAATFTTAPIRTPSLKYRAERWLNTKSRKQICSYAVVAMVCVGLIGFAVGGGAAAPKSKPDCDLTALMPTPKIRAYEGLYKLKHQQLNAFVVGGTGAVGKALIRELLQSKLFNTVTYIGRRRIVYTGVGHQHLVQRLVDFSDCNSPAFMSAFEGQDVGFCALGTTRSAAGASGFVKVDRTYVGGVAAAARAAGTKHFHLVSASNADPDSWLLYPQTKGLVEQDLMSLKFPRLSIYRPAMLLLQEQRDDSRTLESAVRPLAKAASLLSDRVAVPVEDVATAMIVNTFIGPDALHIQSSAVKSPSTLYKDLATVGTPLKGCVEGVEAMDRPRAARGSAFIPVFPCVEVVDNAAILALAHDARASASDTPCDALLL